MAAVRARAEVDLVFCDESLEFLVPIENELDLSHGTIANHQESVAFGSDVVVGLLVDCDIGI